LLFFLKFGNPLSDIDYINKKKKKLVQRRAKAQRERKLKN